MYYVVNMDDGQQRCSIRLWRYTRQAVEGHEVSLAIGGNKTSKTSLQHFKIQTKLIVMNREDCSKLETQLVGHER